MTAPDAFLGWLKERASIDANPWGIMRHRELLWEAYSAGAHYAMQQQAPHVEPWESYIAATIEQLLKQKETT